VVDDRGSWQKTKPFTYGKTQPEVVVFPAPKGLVEVARLLKGSPTNEHTGSIDRTVGQKRTRDPAGHGLVGVRPYEHIQTERADLLAVGDSNVGVCVEQRDLSPELPG
jgi:hypothetical protein